jgi:hypothetical protein
MRAQERDMVRVTEPVRAPEDALRQMVSHCQQGGKVQLQPDQDVDRVGSMFEELLRRHLPVCTCQGAMVDDFGGAAVGRVPNAATGELFTALLKLQAAWHTWCLSQERFFCVVGACRVMLRWSKAHRCWWSVQVVAYVAEVQALCKGMHGWLLVV